MKILMSMANEAHKMEIFVSVMICGKTIKRRRIGRRNSISRTTGRTSKQQRIQQV